VKESLDAINEIIVDEETMDHYEEL